MAWGGQVIQPELSHIRACSTGYNVIPVWKEIPVDMDTPVSLYCKLGGGDYSFLLESLEGGERWGRYSFIGLRPRYVVKSRGSDVTLHDRSRKELFSGQDPVEFMRAFMSRFNAMEPEGLPRFFGGAVGFMGYDTVRFIENLPDRPEDTAGFNDSVFIFPELLLVFDNLKQTLQIIFSIYLDREDDLEDAYKSASGAIEGVVSRIRQGLDYPSPPVNSNMEVVLEPEVSKKRFGEMVERAREYIRAGDIIQVVLSQRFSGRSSIPPFELYRALRRINPSPYLYYLKLADEYLVGSSPEILVRLTDNIVELRPIAGTRPRGATPEEDLALEKELLADPKEKAEHVMLVDLGRNDAGRVCRAGTVTVDDFMVIERYSHVMHIVSGVKGELEPDMDMFDLFRASFPAGTVSGAPKIRAMEIIDELEHASRGPYAGAVGYFGFSGNMDLAITIRTLCQKGEMLYLQAGAGIVADSDPEKEWEETLNKGRALMRAVSAARDFT
jgi:anthranilate synthase component 1